MAELQAAYAQIGQSSFYGNMLENALENSPFLYTITNQYDNFFGSYGVFNPYSLTIHVGTFLHPTVHTSCGWETLSTQSVLEHELGHAATGALDEGPGGMDNTNQNVNPYRDDLGLPPITAYGPNPPFQLYSPIPLPYSGGTLQILHNH